MESHQTSPQLAADSSFRMIDVGEKAVTRRRAVASGRIAMSGSTLNRIIEGTMPKGDVLAQAEIAGIMAAKNTSQILPLCHPLSMDAVRVSCAPDPDSSSILVKCEAITHGKTGVEMEALTGASTALLAIYDLTKGIDPALTIFGIHLERKEGGKSGVWTHPHYPEEIPAGTEKSTPLSGLRAAVITISDRCSRGEAEDKSGPELTQLLASDGAATETVTIVPDEVEKIREAVTLLSRERKMDLVFLTGGTGVSPRDVTPEALAPLYTKRIPGIGELLRASGSRHTAMSWLSRSEGGLVDRTLVIALPGSTKAVREGFEALSPLLSHAHHITHGGSRHP